MTIRVDVVLPLGPNGEKDPNDYQGDPGVLDRATPIEPRRYGRSLPSRHADEGSGDHLDGPAGAAHRSNYLSIGDIISAPLNWRYIIDGTALAGRTYQLFGQWKAGKSLLAMDLALALADPGIAEWAGKKIEDCIVIYVAGESQESIRARIKAHAKRFGIGKGARFHLRPIPVYLTQTESAEALRNEILGFMEECPGIPVVLFIDTLARNFGPGRAEGSDADMGAFINNLIDVVARPTGALVFIVHHPGHAEKGRGRGHSSLPGGVDGTLQLAKEDGVIRLTVSESRDEPDDGTALLFRPEGVELDEVDNFGRPVVAPVLVCLDETQAAAVRRMVENNEPSGRHYRTAKRIATSLGHEQARTVMLGGRERPSSVVVLLGDVEARFKAEFEGVPGCTERQRRDGARKAWDRISPDVIRALGSPLVIDIGEDFEF
jgi:hypothetical protein